MTDSSGTVPTTSQAPTPAPVAAPAPAPAPIDVPAQTPSADPAAATATAPVAASADQPIVPDAAIEVDPVGHDDNDSGYDESIASQFTSLASSVTDYKHENGRRYHAFREGSELLSDWIKPKLTRKGYFFPNDEQEQDRLDIHNFLMNLCLDGRLHLAPVGDDVKRILDVGTGTGSWAIDMGDLYPGAQVVGNDLSPTQPKWVPANVFFEVDDIEDEWVYSTPFDFIHSRYMACSIKDWPKLLERTFKHTKPGGWIEFQDWDLELFSDDGTLKEDSDLLKWDRLILEACDKVGREASPGKYLEEWVNQAGFVNVNHQRFRVPVGPWAKDPKMKKIGAAMQLQMLEGLEGFTLAPLTRVLGWKLEEVEILIAKVRTDLRTSRIHAQADFHVVYAQRPDAAAA